MPTLNASSGLMEAVDEKVKSDPQITQTRLESSPNKKLNLRAGDWVEVRSREEILATLDEAGNLENLPFMPEMFRYCGLKLRVFKRADKTCETVSGWTMRRMENSVLLESIRCDGTAHSGCEARCLIFWKEAWLKRAEKNSGQPASESARPAGPAVAATASNLCTVESILAATRAKNAAGEEIYSCQGTELLKFTSPLKWWDLRQYVRDYRSGNVDCGFAEQPGNSRGERRLARMADALRLFRAAVIFMAWVRGNIVYPQFTGKLDKTPSESLNLQPGELVQVRSLEEILATLNKENKNRGMLFDRELVPYCGGIYKVLGRVHKIIDEKTGKMIDLKNPCIILNGVVCKGEFHGLCPKQVYTYWRENWLKRVTNEQVLAPE